MKILIIGGKGTIGKKVSAHFSKKARNFNWWKKFWGHKRRYCQQQIY